MKVRVKMVVTEIVEVNLDEYLENPSFVDVVETVRGTTPSSLYTSS